MCSHLGTFQEYLLVFMKICKNDFLNSLSICDKMSAYIPISLIVSIFALKIAILGDLGIENWKENCYWVSAF